MSLDKNKMPLQDLYLSVNHGTSVLIASLLVGLLFNYDELLSWAEALPSSPVSYRVNRALSLPADSLFVRTLSWPRSIFRTHWEDWHSTCYPTAEKEVDSNKETILEAQSEIAVDPNVEQTQVTKEVDLSVIRLPTATISSQSAISKQVKVLAAGDSMLGSALQFTLRNYFHNHFDEDHELQTIIKPGTGLTKPKLYNWPNAIQSTLKKDKFTILMIFLGTNDAGQIRSEGHAYRFGGSTWDQVYSERVKELTEAACRNVERVVWVGQLPMKAKDLDDKMAHLNALIEPVLSRTPCGLFIKTSDLFPGKGKFTPMIGQKVKLRNKDGIHLTDDGAKILTEHLMSLMKDQNLI